MNYRQAALQADLPEITLLQCNSNSQTAFVPSDAIKVTADEWVNKQHLVTTQSHDETGL